MSHFSRIKTQMVEKQYIVQSLQDLGYSYEDTGNIEVRGYGRQHVAAEIRVSTLNPGYDIGFVKTGDSYEVVADWYGLHGINQKQFLEQLTQRYAYHTTRAKLEEQGFSLVNEENEKDGRIHLVVRRMA